MEESEIFCLALKIMCNFALSISPLKSADRTKSHSWQDGFLAGREVESELLEPDITILCMKNGTKSIACLMCMVLSCQMFGQMKVYNNGSVTVGANSLNNSSSQLTVFGNNKTLGSKNFSVSFSLDDFGCAKIEGLTQFNGRAWSSFYAKQGTLNYAAYYDGNVMVYGNSYASSDLNLKENIRPIDHPLESVLQLNGIVFDFKKDSIEYPEEFMGFMESCRTNNLGFIAQEVQYVMPELVIEDIASGTLALNYNGFSAVLVEAIKEQQNTIQSLKKEVEELKRCTRNFIDETDVENDSGNCLFQNCPNPASSSTTIEFYLDANAKDAHIVVCNLNGLQLKEYSVEQYGRNIITINANEFVPGMYLYSLLVDGRLIDTKRMVVTSK